MRGIRWLVAAVSAVMIVVALGPPASALSLGEQAQLQAAMQQYVDKQLVDGVYLHLDRDSGEVRKLHPVTAHPMIMQMGAHYVLCFDFKDAAGASHPIDFYMTRKERSYVVFHAAVDDRALLKRLMRDGRITRLER